MKLVLCMYVCCALFSSHALADALFPIAYGEITDKRCGELANRAKESVKERLDLAVCMLSLGVGGSAVDGMALLETLIDETGDPYSMHNYGYMYLEKEEYRAEALNYLMGA